MKTYLTYGLGLAVAGSLLNLSLYFMGFHNDLDKMQTGQWIATAVGLTLTIGALFLGIRAVRENAPDKSLSYGQGVLAGLLIGVFSGIFGAMFSYVYGAIINPEYHELLYELQMQKVGEKGVPAAQLESMEGMMRFFTGPVWMVTASLFFAPIVSTVIALIMSAFLKRTHVAQPPPVET